MSETERGLVIIRPRVGVSARDIAIWLEGNFQEAMTHDAGPRAEQTVTIRGGNPLVNAEITVSGGLTASTSGSEKC